MRMTSSVAIQIVPHMQEFLGHDDLDREILLAIYSLQIDKDRVQAITLDEAIRSTVCRRHSPPDHFGIGFAGSRHPKVVVGKSQSNHITLNERNDRLIRRIEHHRSIPFNR
jgi:hypothetical protein